MNDNSFFERNGPSIGISLGRQLLMARRLCEAGCGFVTVIHANWEFHARKGIPNMPEGMSVLAPPLDHAVAAFLEDIRERGLEEKILLVITGEFGRTLNLDDNLGRHHWPGVCPLVFAGGGLNHGQVIGQSDRRGGKPANDPYSIDDLHATIMHAMFDVGKMRLDPALPEIVMQRAARGKRFDDRRHLLSQMDVLKRRFDQTGELEGAGASQQQAVEVLLRGIADAFDLTQEDPKTIAKYDTSDLFRMEDWHSGGRNYNRLRNQSRVTNLLGKQMLLARRLCEAGCGFVTVVDGCWDFHGDGNNPPTPVGMSLLGPQVDHAVAAFLEDLKDRGLTDDILLLVTGEMGRSPKKSGKNGGTGHWGRLTPLLVAGGGLQMGQVIGRTDANGGEATSQLYLPEHLAATVMQTLFDPGETRLVTGLPTDLARTITSGEPIRELF